LPTATVETPAVFAFDNTYARQLEGFYQATLPEPVAEPRMLRLNHALAEELGVGALGELAHGELASLFTGNSLFPGSDPLAQAYAGHQFGGFSPSLGDGRAHLLGEVKDRHGRRRDIALKGSGRTRFSRNGDGKAAVGPMLREYLIGEAMHGLGIPTSRALAVAATGEPVYRERPLPGAVLTRVASSHLRIGTFQYFAARGENDKLRQLAEYAIGRHDPELLGQPDRYLEWLRAVAKRQAKLVAQWMNVGFIHGVMNTDNMSLSGETIDYGPCAFMEAYDPKTVFSSIDQDGRYAYGNQPLAAQWNFARFAEAVLPLIDEEDPERAVGPASEIVEQFEQYYQRAWLDGMRAKLGFDQPNEGDLELVNDWLQLLHTEAVDFTLGFRTLAEAAGDNRERLEHVFGAQSNIETWLARWRARLAHSPLSSEQRAQIMLRVNPIYIARNHLVEAALSAASERDDLEPFERLLQILSNPFEEQPGFDDHVEPAPAEVTACYQTFCGT
jgi:serine/tyrosine/threonine adenylyltransferase